VSRLRFGAPVNFVYLPSTMRQRRTRHISGATVNHRGGGAVGMNPGPSACSDRNTIRRCDHGADWLGLESPVANLIACTPSVQSWDSACPRSEVSGTRLWGWARERFATPARFFATFFVANYCPLAFLEASGRNLTPDKLPAVEQAPLFAACDEALRRLSKPCSRLTSWAWDTFAFKRAQTALSGFDVEVGTILHPSQLARWPIGAGLQPPPPACRSGNWAAQLTKASGQEHWVAEGGGRSLVPQWLICAS